MGPSEHYWGGTKQSNMGKYIQSAVKYLKDRVLFIHYHELNNMKSKGIILTNS